MLVKFYYWTIKILLDILNIFPSCSTIFRTAPCNVFEAMFREGVKQCEPFPTSFLRPKPKNFWYEGCKTLLEKHNSEHPIIRLKVSSFQVSSFKTAHHESIVFLRALPWWYRLCCPHTVAPLRNASKSVLSYADRMCKAQPSVWVGVSFLVLRTGW